MWLRSHAPWRTSLWWDTGHISGCHLCLPDSDVLQVTQLRLYLLLLLQPLTDSARWVPSVPRCPCDCDWKTPACTKCPHVKEICYRSGYTETPEKKGAGASLPSARRFTGSAPFFSVQRLGFSFWGSCSEAPLAFLHITIQYMRQMPALLILVLKAH